MPIKLPVPKATVEISLKDNPHYVNSFMRHKKIDFKTIKTVLNFYLNY